METIALILAGGSGTRLWPLSRQSMPKQLLALTGNRTLLQETCRRLFPLIPPWGQWIITGEGFYHQVQKQVENLQKEFPSSPIEQYIEVMLEPEGKNTAPAIFWAAERCRRLYGEDTRLLVLPSDHLITMEDKYIESLKKGIDKAGEGSLVTFGIPPTHPETGYGYIKVNGDSSEEVIPVEGFVEKPDAVTAEKFLKDGSYYWNSGMFVFHVGTLLQEAMERCPDICAPFCQQDPFNPEQVKNAYRQTKTQSIDYAVMEHTKRSFMVPASFGWNDVGSWQSLYEVSEKDEQGNVASGKNIAIDTQGCLIYGKERLIATIGIENMAVIDTPDALMVCPLDQTQRIREVVDRLKEQNSRVHIEHQTVERPWGSYTVIQEGPGYKIKKIIVNPKQKLSLQMHYHRSEHWIVVQGTAKITNGSTEIFVHENESSYIAKSTLHRLENPGTIPLEIIEAQCGSYLGEDDIVRIDDDYGREV
ncbi:mannose-1-phosphate guanylyltransferase/mannose-6-phosphate isomerase [Candidatus Contubernalis alkaliaceticus]|uniref:mannose-1-phosphate guanylyltransferase/mannose-6-phosphate isomerase n=1 Tax=Candidatus Contubernalis alkaliaceticus TaxID=338645 RepID=UPI001F4BD16C|nr:mannose-1-phosphate guanylyltransferase/mannose-6-phosphate isomerase [Candidatus Contubernalis alkalaceticus]UNC93637.1 mannose-1-phosphate guanylyltransferase/mannose-6-phosphate isomerase [Candidatus Contubernalis alkalaceticus]